MQPLYFLPVFIATTIFNSVGLFSSLFIMVVNYKTWMKTHTLSSADRILLSVGITRFLLQALFLLYFTCVFISPALLRSVHVATFSGLCWMFLDATSLWFVTLLNTVYCVKITNFHHSVFLLLKRNLSSKIPRLLLACVLLSLFTTLFHFVLRLTSPFLPRVPGRNSTEIDITRSSKSLLASLVLHSSLQFILNMTSASLLIHSLRRHIQKMQRNATGFWSPQTEAHVGAMKLMVSFLILYIPYAIASTVFYIPSRAGVGWGVKSTCLIISTFYHPGHSVLIIFIQPKLKAKAKRIFLFQQKVALQ